MAAIRLLFLALGVRALYEDQIGKFDWRKEMIGYPVLTAFEQVKGPSEYITVFTNIGILASLSARTGEIAWRRTMPKTENVKYVFGLRGIAVSVSDHGIVRYWNSANGVLVKELYSKSPSPITTCSRLPSKNAIICARKKGQDETLLSIFSERAKMYEFTVKVEVGAILTDEGNNLGFLLNTADEVLTVQSIHLNDYSPDENAHTIKVPGLKDLKDINLNVDNKIVYTADGKVISVDLISGETMTVVESLEENCQLVPTGQTEVRHSTDSLLFTCATQTMLIVNLDTPNERIIIESTRVKVHKNVLNPFATVQMDEKNFKIINFVDGQVTPISVKGLIQDIWLNIYPTKTRHEFKIFTLGEDGSVRFGLRDQELWVREEALSDIARVEIIDLPPDSSHNVNPQEWSLSQRVGIQWTLLKTWIQSLLSEIESGNMFRPKTGDPLVSDRSMFRDQFNLHKLIFIVAKNGNVYGLDSLTSEIKWKTRIEKIDSCSIQTLIVSDTNIHEGRVMIVGKCAGEKSELIEINPMSGLVVSTNELRGQEVLRVEILKTHRNHVHPAVVLTRVEKDEVNAEIIGTHIDEIIDEIKEELKWTTFWLVNKEIGQVRGGRVQLGDGQKGIFKIEWTFQVPGDHKITALGSPHHADIIHSQGRPLADRSVFYKYLNPNLMSIVTESNEKSNVEAMAITLYVIDGITGQILHTANHKRSTGPVNIVMAENWLVYSYWAAKMHRSELTAVELYMGEKTPNETHWDSLAPRELPVHIEKAFVLSEEVTALGVTQSARGITNKAVLIATKSGNIVSMPRIFFDPRRRLTPIATDREEGIMPYEPELKLPPNFNINYNKSVEAVEQFHIAITRLESTCIVFSVGRADLFWTRVQPSGMFDVLKDDFDHRVITLIMIGFFIGTAACKRLAQLKITNRLWQ